MKNNTNKDQDVIMEEQGSKSLSRKEQGTKRGLTIDIEVKVSKS